MKPIDWRTSAELVGLAAIVVSLIFVGFELRQSQKIALAAQYQARTESGREFFYQSLASDYRIDDAVREIESWEWPADSTARDPAGQSLCKVYDCCYWAGFSRKFRNNVQVTHN